MTIGEVSKKYDISIDTLRYYERIGLINKIKKNASGFRDYSREDCNWIYFVKCLRLAGVSIERLIEYRNLLKQGKETILDRKQILISQKEELDKKIEEIQTVRDLLNKKIEGYEDIMLNYEHEKLTFNE